MHLIQHLDIVGTSGAWCLGGACSPLQVGTEAMSVGPSLATFDSFKDKALQGGFTVSSKASKRKYAKDICQNSVIGK